MKRFSGYFLFLLLLLNVKIHVTSEQPPPIVELSYGKLQGVFIVAKDGTKYEAFMGIPYAKPPIGELRFEEPQPPSNWTGTYNATYPRDYCLQYSHIHPDYTIRGSEDCLYLNLYRPMTNPNQSEPLDVIVYIHGGAFMFFGSRNYKSAQLIKKNFILIAFNYRLGPLGFLSTEDEVVPGNMGLKDQVAVLKWIRDNIGHFGGNPNSVTISGMSAGGASVQFHMLSPLSKGLFSNAISHSGVATNPWALAEASLQKTKQLATSLDCPTENTTDTISCLKSVPGEQIVSKVPLFQSFLYAPFSPFGPVVEPASARNAFLPEDPSLALTNVTTKVPWLVSFTSAEGLYPAAEFIGNEEFLKKLNSNWNAMAPHLLDYNYTAKLGSKDEISEKIRKHYFNDKPIHESPKQLVELLSDRLFESGIAFSIGKYVLLNICQESEKIEKSEKYKILIGRYLKTRNNGCEYTSKQAQVFVYKFSYSGNFTGAKSFNFSDQSYGVNHGDDLLYIFDNKLFDNFATDEDKEMQKRLINVYDTFIRKSNPEFLDGVAIPPVSLGIRGLKLEYSVLNITAPDNTTVMGSFDFGNAIKFWSYLPILESVSTSGHRGHAH